MMSISFCDHPMALHADEAPILSCRSPAACHAVFATLCVMDGRGRTVETIDQPTVAVAYESTRGVRGHRSSLRID
jgi:hypothetical protein